MRKILAFVLSGFLALSFAGCGDEKIDYSVDGQSVGENSETSDSGTLAFRYGIPDECDVALDVGASGLEKIEIYDSDVTYPDASSMDIAYYILNDFSAEYKQKIVEALFDKSEGIYVYDMNNITKTDIQTIINKYQRYIELCENTGNSSEAKLYKDELTEYENQLSTASDEYPAATDYSEDRYIGTMDGVEYKLLISDSDCSLRMCEDAYTYKNADDIEGVTDCYFESDSEWLADATETFTNVCTLDETEAQLLAEEFLEKMGIDDMILSETGGLYWIYYGESIGEPIKTELDGYSFTYVGAINNVPVSTKSVCSADNLWGNNFNLDIPVDEMTICVDSNGIVSADWVDYLQATGDAENNVELLSFDELLEAANETVADYYSTYPTAYNRIEFNDIELTYFLEEADEEGVFKFVPAWVLSEYEVYADYSEEDSPSQVVVIDATDGSVIDLLSLSKALGTYYEYNAE